MKKNNCSCKSFDNYFDYQHEQKKVAVFKDKGSTTEYRYENKDEDHLAKYRVDGGLIPNYDSIRKCDYLLLNCEKKKSYFIEIKGSDVRKAIKQIETSIDLLKNDLKEFSINARIVFTRTNTINLTDTKFLHLKSKLKKLNGNFKKESRKMIDTE